MYDSLDNYLMGGANNAVQAWNWTTGKTKTDLANLVLNATTITYNSAFALRHPALLLLSAPIFFPAIHIEQKQNIKQDKLEQKAAESGLKDISAELMKTGRKFAGSSKVGFSGTYVPLYMMENPENISGKISAAIMGISFALWASADYIMRVDYLPPRKNCLSRAKDKLKEIITEYKNRPELAPIPV